MGTIHTGENTKKISPKYIYKEMGSKLTINYLGLSYCSYIASENISVKVRKKQNN